MNATTSAFLLAPDVLSKRTLRRVPKPRVRAVAISVRCSVVHVKFGPLLWEVSQWSENEETQ
eukprot:4863189-Pleurochrysis_carterae.AAC.1